MKKTKKKMFITTASLGPGQSQAIILTTHDLPANILELLKKHSEEERKEREKLDEIERLKMEERKEEERERIPILIAEIMTTKKKRDALLELVYFIMDSKEGMK